MTDTITNFPVHHAPQHLLGAPISVPADPHHNIHPQTQRTCSSCGAVRITVHPNEGAAWREWRWSDGIACVQIRTETAPRCVAKAAKVNA